MSKTKVSWDAVWWVIFYDWLDSKKFSFTLLFKFWVLFKDIHICICLPFRPCRIVWWNKREMAPSRKWSFSVNLLIIFLLPFVKFHVNAIQMVRKLSFLIASPSNCGLSVMDWKSLICLPLPARTGT